MKKIVSASLGLCLLFSSGLLANTPPKNILVVKTINYSSNLHWPNSGKEIIIIAAPVTMTEDDALPKKGMNYTANSKYGTGSAINNGFVVYKGKENSIIVSNLQISETYYFSSFEADANGDFTIPGPPLTSFVCMTLGHQAQLVYNSSAEIDAANIIVERSTDSRNWTQVVNAGPLPLTIDKPGHNFYDKGPLNEDCYYRLKHVYPNNIIVTSEPLQFRSFSLTTIISISPSEVYDGKKYFVLADKETLLTVTNAKGEMVKQTTLNDKNGFSYLLQDVPPGIYNIQGSNSDGTLSEKVTIKE